MLWQRNTLPEHGYSHEHRYGQFPCHGTGSPAVLNCRQPRWVAPPTYTEGQVWDSMPTPFCHALAMYPDPSGMPLKYSVLYPVYPRETCLVARLMPFCQISTVKLPSMPLIPRRVTDTVAVDNAVGVASRSFTA